MCYETLHLDNKLKHLKCKEERYLLKGGCCRLSVADSYCAEPNGK